MLCTAIFVLSALKQTPTSAFQTTSFDAGWRFALGNAANPVKDFGFGKTGMGYLAKAGSGEGPVNAGFGDGKWRQLDLPHDWVIELPFDQNGEGGHGYKTIGRDFPENSVGWYRKSFPISRELLGKRISIQFDGIYRNSRVWCNGTFLKHNDSGYLGFSVDLTNTLKYGAKNVITVRVDASEFEGWFYEGAGIYRHTWLSVNDPVSLVKDGQFMMPKVQDGNGVVESQLEIRNQDDKPREFGIVMSLIDSDGKVSVKIGQTLSLNTGETKTFYPKVVFPTPHLWSIEKPNLYTAKVELFGGEGKIDEYTCRVGFKTVVWDPNNGLTINGKYTKIQGTCNHQDAAGVGIALPDKLTYWRIQQLKNMGCNAYRTSHNPPTPELLDACDKLGMVVLDETRAFGDSPEARDQLTRMIRRDRNHPSVLFWSIGNEEFALNGSEEGERMGKAAVQLAHTLDPTRLTTYAGNNGGQYRGVNAAVDIRGFNYGLGAADQYHKDHPTQPVHGSETASTTTTRGAYVDDYKNGRVSAYDRQTVSWGSGAEEWWSYAAAREWFIGGFVWTGFDYRGEPTPTGWPTINSHFGIMDTCGFPKDIYFYYQSWWTSQPVIHILPHWNWKGDEGKEKNVWVFSNADEVDLSLNGQSLGKKKMSYTGHLEWKVNYTPGKLEATGFKGGKQISKEVIETTDEVSSINIVPDHTGIMGDSKEITVVNFLGQDKAGRIVPTANDKMEFEIEGPAKLIGVGNGDPTCLEPDTYAPTAFSQDISTGWKFQHGKGTPAEASATFDDSKWRTVDTFQSQHMESNSDAMVRKKFTIDDVNKWKFLDLGAIDDEGEIYINGKLIKKTTVWDETYQFKTDGLLKQGENSIVIFIHNIGGDGGFSKGASLSGMTMPSAWSRSLFNGRAQAIIQHTGTGSITLRVKCNGKTQTTVFEAK